MLRYVFGISCRSIDSRSDSRSTQSQFAQMCKCVFDGFQTVIQLTYITADFLTQGKWSSIHEVSSSDFHHMHIIFTFLSQRIAQFLNSRNRCFDQNFVSRNVHCSREGVIGRLRFVHIVIRMQYFFFIGQSATIQNMGSVSDYFIHIHVALSTASGLPNHQRKLVIQLSCQNFICCLSDQIRFLLRQNSCIEIGQCSSFL
ncbi:hypothetical protein D3C80_1323720 [compost metagenome]